MRNHKHLTLVLYKMIKMNGHSVVFGLLVQKLEQITPDSSTLQDDQNEWSQCTVVFGRLVPSYDILGFHKIGFSRTMVNIQL